MDKRIVNDGFQLTNPRQAVDVPGLEFQVPQVVGKTFRRVAREHDFAGCGIINKRDLFLEEIEFLALHVVHLLVGLVRERPDYHGQASKQVASI